MTNIIEDILQAVLYQVVDDADGYSTIYCTTTDKKLANKVLKRCKQAKNKHQDIKIKESKIDNKEPFLTFIITPAHKDAYSNKDWDTDIFVEAGEYKFAPYVDCNEPSTYAIKAQTLAEAKRILKKQHKVTV